jgi:hypothetical protein
MEKEGKEKLESSFDANNSSERDGDGLVMLLE